MIYEVTARCITTRSVVADLVSAMLTGPRSCGDDHRWHEVGHYECAEISEHFAPGEKLTTKRRVPQS